MNSSSQSDQGPMRILILADWLGDTPASAPPAERRPLGVDIDNFHKVMAGMAPSLAVDGHEKIDLASIEDFHPDRLCQSLSRLKSLMVLYKDLNDPARLQTLMEELARPGDAPPTSAAKAHETTDLERLLGGRPPEQERELGHESRMRKMLGELVSPHLVDTRSAEPHRQAIATCLAEELSAILCGSRFQSLEANWRGLWWLVSQLVSEDVQMALLPLTHAEILADLQAVGTDLETAAIHRQLAAGTSQPPWSLVVALHEFGPEVEDVMALTAMAVIAEATAVPVITSASPRLVGSDGYRDLVDPLLWTGKGPDGQALELWQTLKQSSAGQWISLVLPRVLARLPYGPDSDPIDSFRFNESKADDRSLPKFVGALAAAAAMGINFENHGHGMDPASPVGLEDLPGFSFSEDGEARFQSAVEVVLPDRAMDALIQRGLTPVAGALNRTNVYVPGCYAVSGCVLRGRWRH